MEQLKLFGVDHVHQFEVWRGPYLASPEIRVTDSRWCWTCISWIKDGDDGNTHQD